MLCEALADDGRVRVFDLEVVAALWPLEEEVELGTARRTVEMFGAYTVLGCSGRTALAS